MKQRSADFDVYISKLRTQGGNDELVLDLTRRKQRLELLRALGGLPNEDVVLVLHNEATWTQSVKAQILQRYKIKHGRDWDENEAQDLGSSHDSEQDEQNQQV